MATNMKENGFETMIVKYLVENNHYEEGGNSDYNKIYAIDEVRLFRFLHDTQDEKLAELRIEDNEIEKKKFLDRLSKKISDDGVINIIRKGMKYKNKTVDFYMVRPSEGNQDAKESYDKNIFSVTRQLRYSNDYGRLALDVCIFLNGLPIITMELKNQITKQNHDDAIRQYMTDRTPDELLFQFKRCIVHFAVDDDEIYMCRTGIPSDNIMFFIATMKEIYDVCSLTYSCENYMWKAYSNNSRGICLVFNVSRHDDKKKRRIIHHSIKNISKRTTTDFIEIKMTDQASSSTSPFKPDVVIRRGAVSIEISNTATEELLNKVGGLLHA